MCHDKCVAGDCESCALDSTNVKKSPWDHTVHCIRDVDVCIDSGYFLAFNVGSSSAPDYRPRFMLDDVGNQLAFDLISATSTHEGLALTVTGYDDGSGTLRVSSVVECVGFSCDGVCVGCTGSPTFSGIQGPVNHDSVLAHGSLLIVAWAFLAPGAFLVKRHAPIIPRLNLTRMVKGYPLHFLIHACLMLAVVLLTIIAVSIAVAGFDRRALYGHLPVGFAVVAVAFIQPFPALFCRPDKESPKRVYFNWFHRAGGAFCLFFGAVNVVLGAMNYRVLWDPCRASIIIGFALGGVSLSICLGVVLEVYRCQAIKQQDHRVVHDSGEEADRKESTELAVTPIGNASQ
uniref:Cytochrome b561 domain-containing protein n=1 Tax=Noctiluca scintillans TaxID=2966 RepID=A0A7S1ATV7_NOCSC